MLSNTFPPPPSPHAAITITPHTLALEIGYKTLANGITSARNFALALIQSHLLHGALGLPLVLMCFLLFVCVCVCVFCLRFSLFCRCRAYLRFFTGDVCHFFFWLGGFLASVRAVVVVVVVFFPVANCPDNGTNTTNTICLGHEMSHAEHNRSNKTDTDTVQFNGLLLCRLS